MSTHKKKRLKIDFRKIKPTATYDYKQIAKDFDRTVETVRRWKREGMPIIEGTYPILVDGKEFLEWHVKRREANKFPCALDELYCFKCHIQRHPKIGSAIIRPVNNKRISIEALCEVCSNKLTIGRSVSELAECEATLESYMQNVRYLIQYR